jgi:Membrane transport protein.
MLDLPVLMKQVFVLDSALPGMAQNPILSEAFGADSEYAAIGTSLTTVLSIIVIPLCMALTGSMFK